MHSVRGGEVKVERWLAGEARQGVKGEINRGTKVNSFNRGSLIHARFQLGDWLT